jgi:hypothetical protein
VALPVGVSLKTKNLAIYKFDDLEPSSNFFCINEYSLQKK